MRDVVAPAGALAALRAGECALIATDTVFGLAAVPGTAGEQRIFELKGRPATMPLAWLVDGPGALDVWGIAEGGDAAGGGSASTEDGGAAAEGGDAADGLDIARKLARAHWPGALTIVVRASSAARDVGVLAADGTVALRMPDCPSALALVRELGSPLACTSANLHGRPSASRIGELDAVFDGVPGRLELPRRCPAGEPSTIVDCTTGTPRVLREGPVRI